MRSQLVDLVEYGGRWNFDEDNLLVQVAEHRLGLNWKYVETQARIAQACEELMVDTLEDVFVLRYVSIDLRRRTAFVFYEDSPEWCFEHRMYITEDRHFAACGKTKREEVRRA